MKRLNWLTDAGDDVIEAANGQEGLDSMLQQRPDLMICDRLMPEMPGDELLKEPKV